MTLCSALFSTRSLKINFFFRDSLITVLQGDSEWKHTAHLMFPNKTLCFPLENALPWPFVQFPSLCPPPVILLFISHGYNESSFNKRLFIYPWVHSDPKCTPWNNACCFFENTIIHIWNFMFGSSAGRDTMRIRGAFWLLLPKNKTKQIMMIRQSLLVLALQFVVAGGW